MTLSLSHEYLKKNHHFYSMSRLPQSENELIMVGILKFEYFHWSVLILSILQNSAHFNVI